MCSSDLEVTGHTDTERAKPPKKGGGIVPKVTNTQEKQLEITIANDTLTDFKGLTVKYYLFAKDLSKKEYSIPRMGKRDIDLPGRGSVKIKSETLTFTYTDQYSKKSQGQVVFVPEEGQKYAGNGVQVFRAEALVAEKFDPPELKTKLGSAWIEPAGGKKKSRKYKD